MTRRVAALVGAAVIALAGAVAGASVASAHAELVESNPLDGAMLIDMPTVIELTFSEPIAKPADIVVLGPDNQPLPSSELQMIDAVAWVELDRPAQPAEGWYTVSYQVTSADGHLVSGSTTFMLHTDGNTAMPPAVGGGAVPVRVTGADPLVVGLLAGAAAVALVVGLGAVRRLLVTSAPAAGGPGPAS